MKYTEETKEQLENLEIPYEPTLVYVRVRNKGLKPKFHKSLKDADGNPRLLQAGEHQEVYFENLVNKVGQFYTWAKPERLLKKTRQGYVLVAVSDIPGYCEKKFDMRLRS